MKPTGIPAVLTLLIAVLANGAAASADVQDNAKLFRPDAVTKADRDIAAMKAKHNKELYVDTFSAVPDDQKASLANDGREKFFQGWAARLGKEHNGNGVEILICMDPPQITVLPGKMTRERGDFTEADSKTVRKEVATLLHDKKYDDALAEAVSAVEAAYSRNIVGEPPQTRPAGHLVTRSGEPNRAPSNQTAVTTAIETK